MDRLLSFFTLLRPAHYLLCVVFLTQCTTTSLEDPCLEKLPRDHLCSLAFLTIEGDEEGLFLQQLAHACSMLAVAANPAARLALSVKLCQREHAHLGFHYEEGSMARSQQLRPSLASYTLVAQCTLQDRSGSSPDRYREIEVDAFYDFSPDEEGEGVWDFSLGQLRPKAIASIENLHDAQQTLAHEVALWVQSTFASKLSFASNEEAHGEFSSRSEQRSSVS